jgi:hypothetical protein
LKLLLTLLVDPLWVIPLVGNWLLNLIKMKTVKKLSVPECDLKGCVEHHLNNGYELLGFSYTGNITIQAAGGFQEVTVLFVKSS